MATTELTIQNSLKELMMEHQWSADQLYDAVSKLCGAHKTSSLEERFNNFERDMLIRVNHLHKNLIDSASVIDGLNRMDITFGNLQKERLYLTRLYENLKKECERMINESSESKIIEHIKGIEDNLQKRIAAIHVQMVNTRHLDNEQIQQVNDNLEEMNDLYKKSKKELSARIKELESIISHSKIKEKSKEKKSEAPKEKEFFKKIKNYVHQK